MATLSPPLIRKYLTRVGQPADVPLPPPTLRTLARLHWAHLTTLPFENLSLKLEAARAQHGVEIGLRDVYSKMVLSRRGGYCFEQNGLFGAVLRSLGFDVIDAAARVVQSGQAQPAEVEEAPLLGDGGEGEGLSGLKGILEPAPELRLSGHDHHILLVSLPAPGPSPGSSAPAADGNPGSAAAPRFWLADVGFGGQALPLPLLLPEGAPQYAAPQPDAGSTDPYAGQDWAQAAAGQGAEEGAGAGDLPLSRLARYRLRLGLPGLLAEPDPSCTPHFQQRAGYYLQYLSGAGGEGGGSWRDLYFFRLDEFLPQDYAMQNHYIETNPASHFRKNLVCALQTPRGRVTLLNSTFRAWRDGEEEPEEEREVAGEEQLTALLRERFGIELL